MGKNKIVFKILFPVISFWEKIILLTISTSQVTLTIKNNPQNIDRFMHSMSQLRGLTINFLSWYIYLHKIAHKHLFHSFEAAAFRVQLIPLCGSFTSVIASTMGVVSPSSWNSIAVSSAEQLIFRFLWLKFIIKTS